LGKIVRGARVAQSSYVLKPPAAPPPVDMTFADEPVWNPAAAPESAYEPPAPSVDMEVVRAAASALIDRAAGDAEALIRDARDRAASLIEDAQARVAQIETEARATGFDRGVTDGRASAQAEMDEMLETMRGLIEMARIERHKIIESAEPELLRLSVAIAERILHKHVALDSTTVLDMVRGAVTRLVNRENVTVRVNPADIELMRENRDRLMMFNDIEHLRLIEDQRVDRGGVLIETDAGTIDSKVSTQLLEARRLLAIDERVTVAPPSEGELLHSPAQAS
jgi:flagellar assembly protein FliH